MGGGRKTDWEISQILNISEKTAREYVQNALMKLKATTRAQAVAAAIFTKQLFSQRGAHACPAIGSRRCDWAHRCSVIQSVNTL
jgi:hypothetical protein